MPQFIFPCMRSEQERGRERERVVNSSLCKSEAMLMAEHARWAQRDALKAPDAFQGSIVFVLEGCVTLGLESVVQRTHR